MPAGRRIWAFVASAAGSAGLLISLWLPWYSFRIPGAVLDQAVQLSQQFGSLAPLVRQGAEIARNLGPIQLTAWRVLEQADILIAVAAAVGGGLALLAATGRARGAGRIIAAAGAVALVVAGYRTISPPGSGAGYLHAAWGAWLAVGCCAITVVAGLLATSDEARADAMPAARDYTARGIAPEPPASWSTASSVPPPAV